MDETDERVVNWAYPTALCGRVLAGNWFKIPLTFPR